MNEKDYPTTVEFRQRHGSPEVPSPELRVVHSPDSNVVGRVLALDGRTWTLGRAGEPEIDDPGMSRTHLRISPAGFVYRVDDLDSRNGCYLDGQRVQTGYIGHGAILRAGDTLWVCDEPPPTGTWPHRDDADADRAVTLVGISRAAIALRAAVDTVARARGPVLLQGPSGTGKEVVARAIHHLSDRKGQLVPVNCAAITHELAETELFGHTRAAFTGSAGARLGLFRQAEGGTLLLDEIGDMPKTQQAKLLRVLEDGVVRPVGADVGHKIDVRVIAATNVDLSTSDLRTDLLARLSEWTLTLPPLRARRVDVVPLFTHFITTTLGASPELSADLVEALLLHDWPMNVRELARLANRTGDLAASAPYWDLDLLPAPLQRAVLSREGDEADRTPPREAIEAALREEQGNVSRVARRFGCDRKQIYRWLERFRLDAKAYR